MTRHTLALMVLGLAASTNLVYAFDLGGLEKKLQKAAPLTEYLQKTSREEEIEIGRQVAGTIMGASPLIDDDALQRYVNTVGRWVAAQSGRPNDPWHFGVIDSPDVNAFAAPGGYILVTKGLYALLENESELAGVLAHEIAHVTARHHIELMKKSKMIQTGEQALSKNVGAAKVLVANGAEIMARGLDKEAEFEADRIGVVLAARAGYDPYALPAVLQKIAMIKPSDGSVALLFKTHPHPDVRLEKLGRAIGSRFDNLAPPKDAVDGFYRLKS